MWSFISAKKITLRSIALLLICCLLTGGLVIFGNWNNILLSISLKKDKFGQTPAMAEGNAVSVPVLVYHGITIGNSGSNQDKNVSADGYSISQAAFREQMNALWDAGYKTVKLTDFESFLKGQEQLPDKSFLLTFDDGRKDSFYPTDPILKAYGFNAVIFPIAAVVDKNPAHLTTAELKKALATGRWEIGSHGFDDHHQIITDANGNQGDWLSNLMWLPDKNRIETETEYENRISNDMISAKKFFHNQLDINTDSFAFPFNDYGQEKTNDPLAKAAISRIARSNFDFVFYQINPDDTEAFNYPADNAFMVRRIETTAKTTKENLMNILAGGGARSLPYTLKLGNNNGWLAMRDNFVINKDKTMTLGSGVDNTGNEVSLEGALNWQNYNFNATIDWLKGTSVSLLARYQDESNYLACDYSDNNVRIEQKINDQTMILKQEKIVMPFLKNNLDLSTSVQNNTAACSINGNEIVRADNIAPELNHGGIGLETWDQKIGNSEITVKNIEVK